MLKPSSAADPKRRRREERFGGGPSSWRNVYICHSCCSYCLHLVPRIEPLLPTHAFGDKLLHVEYKLGQTIVSGKRVNSSRRTWFFLETHHYAVATAFGTHVMTTDYSFGCQKQLFLQSLVLLLFLRLSQRQSRVRGHRVGPNNSGVEQYPMEAMITKPKQILRYSECNHRRLSAVAQFRPSGTCDPRLQVVVSGRLR